MSKLIATLVATLFAATAFAQTNATPPVQPAAGVNTKAEVKNGGPLAGMADKPVSDKAAARKIRSDKRKAKRVEKVGDKPLN